jgi:FixJ family two-component response regulator
MVIALTMMDLLSRTDQYVDPRRLQAAFGERDDALPLIFLTGHGDIPLAVAALKRGAFDFVAKPCLSEACTMISESLTFLCESFK